MIDLDKVQYILYHGIMPTMLLNLDKDTGNLLSYHIINKDRAPYMCEDRRAFNSWWERRAIPKNQQNSKILINDNTNMTYMIQNLSLSLIDNYWVKPASNDFNYTWDDINLYTNNFAEIDFSYTNLENITPFKPSATTQGELAKRWVIKDNKRYLIKGNYGNMCRQSINEVFASLVHKKQGRRAVDYELVTLPTTMGNGIGCISENFTNIDLEFIPAYDITYLASKDNSKSVYQKYIDTCVLHGINKDVMQDFMDYMVLSDFLLTNTDRHLNNLGVLRNTETLQFVEPAPLFDTGNSMFYSCGNSYDVLNVHINSFYNTEGKMLDQVVNRKALDLSLLPSVTDIDKLYKYDDYYTIYRAKMLEGYEKKIEMLDAFQRGLSINPKNVKYYERPEFTKTSSKDCYEER